MATEHHQRLKNGVKIVPSKSHRGMFFVCFDDDDYDSGRWMTKNGVRTNDTRVLDEFYFDSVEEAEEVLALHLLGWRGE